MARDSAIEWTTHTFNPWRGCTKVSAGCAHCYAESFSGRNPKTLGVWGPNGTRVVAAPSAWREPLKWDKAAKDAGERHRVFCASLADVFEDWQGPMADAEGERLYFPNNSWEDRRPWVPVSDCGGDEKPIAMQDVRNRLFRLIADTPNLDWLLLTKRPEHIAKMMPEDWVGIREQKGIGYAHYQNHPPRNVWLGTSVENQAAADERIPHLLRVPAAVRFLSCEPLLGPVDLSKWFAHPQLTGLGCHVGIVGDKWRPGIDWVVVGGESGPGARPMHPDWARSIRDQCQAAGVPFFFKQHGEYVENLPGIAKFQDWGRLGIDGQWIAYPSDRDTIVNPTKQLPPDSVCLARVGKKNAGRLLDGREWNEFPEVKGGV